MLIKKACNLLAGLLFVLSAHGLNAAQTEVTVAYVGSTEHPAYSGFSQGLKEANLQGRFLGQIYNVDIFPDVDGFLLTPKNYLSIIAAIDKKGLLLLRETNRYVPILSLVAEDDSLRTACLGNILNIIPGQKMLVDAVSQWQQKHPGSAVSAAAWHSDFVKFAARDLNKRYRKTFNTGMDSHAWAGWAAIKMVSDTVARESITDPLDMLNYLKTKLSFDGQKGLDMNFRETGQLRQLLLLVENGQLKGEAPVRGVSSDIDSLGIRECSK